MSDERLLGPASVQWNDYVGTAAADDADAVVHSRSMYEIAGLDRNRWTIVSIDVDRWDTSHQVTVYAFDRQRHEVESPVDLEEFAESRGDLPVTAFHFDDPTQVEDFRTEAFKHLAVRLVVRGIRDQQLVVDSHERVVPTH